MNEVNYLLHFVNCNLTMPSREHLLKTTRSVQVSNLNTLKYRVSHNYPPLTFQLLRVVRSALAHIVGVI